MSRYDKWMWHITPHINDIGSIECTRITFIILLSATMWCIGMLNVLYGWKRAREKEIKAIESDERSRGRWTDRDEERERRHGEISIKCNVKLDWLAYAYITWMVASLSKSVEKWQLLSCVLLYANHSKHFTKLHKLPFQMTLEMKQIKIVAGFCLVWLA